ncbi:hypothetical protein [Stackebrandtia nassauensis]|uniref:Uncharacterized protein n=1 Tax=Stackebrandtia nassauensis (strain DSM 44728 / CIP 108903 / NRRL B-16338 / NBRC 102104 / LLR-40K-21) TaxID=446470 RepID=D3PX68_STANL|nr:hypothetical protein [Stackebrandtia nassauensis]ADD41331.1 hypothetical protein Snas_1628 [Stackebrandtia nassauensis DSM 44728]
MGKKPFILMALGIFLIVGAFTFGVSDPTCGSGRGAPTMSPGEVCVNESTGEKQTYDEAKAQQNKQIRIGLPIVGGIMIVYGAFTAIKRKRDPNWRTANAKAQPVAAGQPVAPGQPVPPQQPHGGQPPQAPPAP